MKIQEVVLKYLEHENKDSKNRKLLEEYREKCRQLEEESGYYQSNPHRDVASIVPIGDRHFVTVHIYVGPSPDECFETISLYDSRVMEIHAVEAVQLDPAIQQQIRDAAQSVRRWKAGEIDWPWEMISSEKLYKDLNAMRDKAWDERDETACQPK